MLKEDPLSKYPLLSTRGCIYTRRVIVNYRILNIANAHGEWVSEKWIIFFFFGNVLLSLVCDYISVEIPVLGTVIT